jgi:2-dehydropantoate 2-reductase
MELLIAGTGALACLFAARLASSGHRISMMGSWPEGLAALRKFGVRLRDLAGNSQSFYVNILDGKNCEGNFTHCLVLVKSWQTVRVARQLKKVLSADGLALTLQNGLGNEEVLKEALSPVRVALGVTTEGAKMLEPGYVEHTGQGKISLGIRPREEPWEELFTSAGFKVEIVSDPVSQLWGKLVINAAINPLTALLRVRNGELLARPAAREIMAEIASEATAVAAGRGIRLPYAEPIHAVEDVARATAANNSSMLQDVISGRQTEIEAINGAIVREGELIGVPTPINRILWKLVKSLNHDE